MTAGQSLSLLQSPASPDEVSQSPRPPVLPTLSWPLTWEARQESSKMFVTEFISTTDAVGTGKQEVFSWVECLRVLQCGGRKRTNYMRQHLITKD